MSGHFRLCRSALGKLLLPWLVLVLIFQGITFAGIFGTVRGIVHDAQHRPIEGATVVARHHCAQYERVPRFLEAQESVAFFDCVRP